MTGWILLSAFLLIPLACWALLARTKVLGWAFAIVFAAYAVAEGSQLQGGWPFRDEPPWLLLGLPVLTVVALVVGTVLEHRELGGPGKRWTGRNVTGVLMSTLYGLAVIGITLLFLSVVMADPDSGFSSSAHMASSSYVLPLGPGLTVKQDQLGCGTSRCTTDYYVTYPGLSEHAALQQVVSQLDRVHGWSVSTGTGLTDCRHLGGQDVCVEVIDATASRVIMIELDSGSLMDGG